MTTNDQLVYSTDLAGRGVWEVALEYARQQGRLHLAVAQPLGFAGGHLRNEIERTSGEPCRVCDDPLVSRMDGLSRPRRPGHIPARLLDVVPCGLLLHAAGRLSVPLGWTARVCRLGGRISEELFAGAESGPGCLGLRAGCFFMAFFQYETGALIAATLLLWFIHTRVPAQKRQRHLYAATAMSLGLYAVAYASWRPTHGTAYEGATLGDLSPVAIARVLAGVRPSAHCR